MAIAKTMQLVGYTLWGIAGVVPACHLGGSLLAHHAWLVAYAAFGVAFHAGSRAPNDPARRQRRLAALGIMATAMVVMEALLPCGFGALTLVVVASKAALVLSARASLAGAFAQTAIVASFLIPDLGWTVGGAQIIALAGFQAFACAAVLSARGESDARLALVVTNEQLVATRALLSEASRAQERERIARDLHDALGHSLTALVLQLEIASHLGEEEARAHVTTARDFTTRLLDEVRDVVGKMRTTRPSRLVTAIRALVVDVPGVALHLDVPESLIVEEPSRVDCVVRCVQEIVTNARRHAQAQNLWICLRRDGDALSVLAHDDGRGAADLRGGSGLNGMRARLEEMGGWLEVTSAPARSFAIRARLPLGPACAAVTGAVS